MHLPVLKKEVIDYLDPKPGEIFIDCTVGEGGHACAILEKIGPEGKLLGIDRDPEILENLKKRISDKRMVLARGNFADLKEIAEDAGFENISGILLDLGFCTWHIEESKKGFSFLKDEVLDMRYCPGEGITAKDILNSWEAGEIERILKLYGEERFARIISERIIEARKRKEIKSTFELARIIEGAVPSWYRKGKINCATKTFQALRICVNEELENLEKALPQTISLLGKGGRMAVISFHSLEDRIVKRFFIAQARKEAPLIRILTKKPVAAQKEEARENPRARSAKLRAAVKIS